MTVYSMRSPAYRASSRDEMLTQALEQPMSGWATYWDQAKGGALSSFGLGTALRGLPEEAPDEQGLIITPSEGGESFHLGDNPTARRRATVAGAQVRQETTEELDRRRDDAGAMSEDQYKTSPYFRDDVPWDRGMTEDRAASLAMMYDARKVREFYAAKRPITSFFGNLTGQAVDPINYVPVAGPLVKAAAIAKVGKVGGAAIAGSLDAAANTAIFGVATAGQRAKLGDDVSFQAIASEIATAALIGAAFGSVGGLLDRRAGSPARTAIEDRLATLKTTQEARAALNEAIGGLASGDDIALSPTSTTSISRMFGDNTSRASGNAPSQLSRSSAQFSVPITERPEFKEWFTGSQVTDDSGAPLVLYHGSLLNFDAFRAGKNLAGQENGMYFTPDPEVASLYASSPDGRGGNVAPVYLSAKNVQTVDFAGGADAPDGRSRIRVVADARASGFDGVKLQNTKDAGGVQDQYVVFEPGQIKSRFNTGGFDRADARLIDTAPPKAEPLPEGRQEAEIRLPKPDDVQAAAAQYRINSETGSFLEEPEIEQLALEGRLTEDDAAVLADAQTAFEDGAAYGEAMKSLVGCLL